MIERNKVYDFTSVNSDSLICFDHRVWSICRPLGLSLMKIEKKGYARTSIFVFCHNLKAVVTGYLTSPYYYR